MVQRPERCRQQQLERLWGLKDKVLAWRAQAAGASALTELLCAAQALGSSLSMTLIRRCLCTRCVSRPGRPNWRKLAGAAWRRACGDAGGAVDCCPAWCLPPPPLAQSNIETTGYRSLQQGEEVEFDLVVGEDGKRKAFHVTGPQGAPPQVHTGQQQQQHWAASSSSSSSLQFAAGPAEGGA